MSGMLSSNDPATQHLRCLARPRCRAIWPQRSCVRLPAARVSQPTNKCYRTMTICKNVNSGYWPLHLVHLNSAGVAQDALLVDPASQKAPPEELGWSLSEELLTWSKTMIAGWS